MIITSSECKHIMGAKPGNPRSSEGSFLRLDDGRIAFAYSHYIGTSDDDNAACDIRCVFSSDNGETWGDETELVKASEYGEINVMSVSLVRMNNGDIGLFFILKHTGISTQYMLRRYKNDFNNIVEEVSCFPNDHLSYYVMNNDRVLHLKNGKWLVASAYHHTSTDPEKVVGKPKPYTYIEWWSNVHFFESDDDGHSWHKKRVVLNINDRYSQTGLQEPGLVELPGGQIYCYSRTDRMYQYESFSMDGGDTWLPSAPSRFTSPDSPMLIKQNPFGGKYYAIWNPIPKYMTRELSPCGWGRTPLVMAESDDGVKFSEPVIIEDDPIRGFCYPAMYFLDERTLLVAYCCGGAEEKACLNQTAIRKITIE